MRWLPFENFNTHFIQEHINAQTNGKSFVRSSAVLPVPSSFAIFSCDMGKDRFILSVREFNSAIWKREYWRYIHFSVCCVLVSMSCRSLPLAPCAKMKTLIKIFSVTLFMLHIDLISFFFCDWKKKIIIMRTAPLPKRQTHTRHTNNDARQGGLGSGGAEII